MKISDDEISKAIPPRSCSCWIDGAKWHREKMEEQRQRWREQSEIAGRKNPLTHDEKVQEGQERGEAEIAELNRMLADEEPFRQKQESIMKKTHKFEFSRMGVPTYYKCSDGSNWKDFSRKELERMATMSVADARPYIMAPEQKQAGEKARGWMDKSELMSDMAKYRETHPLKFGSADPEWGISSDNLKKIWTAQKPTLHPDTDHELRLLAVQKTNSLEEAEKVLRWLKGEGNG